MRRLSASKRLQKTWICMSSLLHGCFLCFSSTCIAVMICGHLSDIDFFQQHVFLSPILKLHCIWSGIHGNLRDLDRFPPQQRPFAFCCAHWGENRAVSFFPTFVIFFSHTFHFSVSRRISCSFKHKL